MITISEYRGVITSPSEEKAKELLEWLLQSSWLVEIDNNFCWTNSDNASCSPAFLPSRPTEIILNAGEVENIHQCIDIICELNKQKGWIDNNKTKIRAIFLHRGIDVCVWNKEKGYIDSLDPKGIQKLFGCKPEHIIYDYDVEDHIYVSACHINTFSKRARQWLSEV